MSADIQPGTAGHTPGPWAYSEQTGEIYHDDGDVRPLIATVSLDNTTDEQADADARLIAAAPILLEGAQDTVEALKLLRIGLTERAPETLELIDAHIGELEYGIAKATGVA